jgi:tetratricopeptide (TPR) repeat protein
VDGLTDLVALVLLTLALCFIACANSSCNDVRSGLALNRAGELYEQRRYTEALEAYREAVRLVPNFGAAHCGLANTLKALGRSEEAIVSYRTAVRLEPSYVRCRYPLAELLYKHGDHDQAQAECKVVLQQAPDTCECKVYLAVIAEGRREAEARKLFDDLERIAPGCVEGIPGASTAYERLGRRRMK